MRPNHPRPGRSMRRLGRPRGSASALCLGVSFGVVLALATPSFAAPEGEPDPAAAASAADAAAAHEAFTALSAEYQAAREAWYVARREWADNRTDESGAQRPAPVSPDAEYIAKFRAAAATYAQTEGAVPFLVKAFGMARSGDVKAAGELLDTLVADHVASQKLDQLTFSLIYGAYTLGNEKVNAAITQVVAGSPHDSVKGALLYARGALVSRNRSATDQERAAAVDDLTTAAELTPGSRYGKFAVSTKYELQNLQVGMVAPEIVGADLDAVPFKLSDYRGKVVFLDFWGDW